MRARKLSIPFGFGLTLAVACTSAPPSAVRQEPAPAMARLDAASRAHQALNRLTFGAQPGDFAAVQRMGVDAWIELQLHPERIPDARTDSVLATLETQRKLPFELIADHLSQNEVTQRTQLALKEADTVLQKANEGHMLEAEAVRRDATATLDRFHKEGVTTNALAAEMVPAKVLRAVISERQLQEVMVDFWENHFSVSINKTPNRFAMSEYDRVVIRPHVLGKFRDLLGAVAHSTEMLYYLDNYQSSVDSLHPATGLEAMIEARRRAAPTPPLGLADTTLFRVPNQRRNGLNENYARELMELHTMGVDGGYTQHDVIEVARCLTGWSIEHPELGGRFVFRPDAHDGGEKVVLGTRIPAGGGVEDGEQVLDIVARHPSTAHYIARKLVTHFVSDAPPPALVERVAQTYLRTDGDIREVMRTIIMSPEFNAPAAYRAKVKTPFELVVSAARLMNAPPDTTGSTAALVAGMGQPIWGHLTPDGWPDQGVAWMNSGSLLNRVNFGTTVGTGKLRGVTIAKWPPAAQLITLTPEAEVAGVINLVFGGDVSAATRQALLSVAPAQGSTPAARFNRLGDLIATALGSPEFQQR